MKYGKVFMESVLCDLRYGIRTLAKSPVFAMIALVSLTLGIGANAVIFSLLNNILLKSLSYKDPDRIIVVWGVTGDGSIANRNQVSATDVDDWRNQNSVFEEITTYGGWSATFSGDGRAERIQGIQVGDGFFQIMRGSPLLGRVFLPEEQERGKDTVIVLDYGLWQRRFGGDPQIIGSKINLNNQPYTIVGVMPSDFRPLPVNLVNPQGQFYRPVAEPHDESERSARHLRCIARLKQGVTLAQAQSEMSMITSRMASKYPVSNTDYGVRLTTLPDEIVGGLRPSLLALFGAVIFVLLIACANVGSLLLARSIARQKEFAIRSALGATRFRIVRQLLTESLLLAMLSGALALLLSIWGNDLINSLVSRTVPELGRAHIDARVLSFTIALSLLTSLLFGLAPAINLSKPDLNVTLKSTCRATSTSSSGRMRRTLVIAEISLALVLLVCAGLLIRSVKQLRDVNAGFNPNQLLTMNLSLPAVKYPSEAARSSFFKQVIGRISALPGVESAGATHVLPFSSNFDGRNLEVEGLPRTRGQEINVDLYVISSEYLKTMQTEVLSGRDFTEQDTAEAPKVAIINQMMARSLWPGQDPIGRRVRFPGSAQEPDGWRTVVGVVSSVKQYGLDKEDKMQLYLPQEQFPVSTMTLVLRTSIRPESLIALVRREVQAEDKDQALYDIATMEQLVEDSMTLRRFFMLLLGLFSVLAVSLAAMGIYGIISTSVTQRTHEIGIRMALGASARDILILIVGEGARLAAVGIGSGLALALLLTRLIAGMLYGVGATDPATFLLVGLLLLVVALLACYIPARRAIKIEPQIALRHE